MEIEEEIMNSNPEYKLIAYDRQFLGNEDIFEKTGANLE